jgi:AefR-like transcriptional repressor, C-terminal domain
LRIVIAIADRMPEIGKAFYETGPANGIHRLAAYLQAQVKAGRLVIEDCEVAAAQFLDACQSTLFKPVLFNFAPPPPKEQIERVVAIAVKAFMAAYRAA